MTLRVGYRGSKLARAQGSAVRKLIEATLLEPTEEVIVSSAGDADQTRALARFSEPGAFTKSLEDALRDGRIECAVHSLKDLPLEAPAELPIAAIPARGDARDVLIARDDARDYARAPLGLRAGARVGTSSPRRQTQLLDADPEAIPVDVRGNVDTRVKLVESGVVDALLLAKAGLDRAGIAIPRQVSTRVLELDAWPTAPGQGALAVQTRADLAARFAPLDDRATREAVEMERALLATLGGGCGLSLGASAVRAPSGWTLHASLGDDDWYARDGPNVRRATVTGAHAGEEAAKLLTSPPERADRPVASLAGKRVLVTFDGTNGAPYVARIEEAGARGALWALTRHEPLDVELGNLRASWPHVGWLLVASARAVPASAAVRDALGGLPEGARVGAVGAATARALRGAGFPVHLVSPDGTGAALAALAARWVAPRPGAEVALLPGAAEPTPDARKTLAAAGFTVIEIPTYRTLATSARAPPFEADAIVVTAASAARALPATDAALIAIGPTTAAALRERGLQVKAVASCPTPAGVLDALVETFQ